MRNRRGFTLFEVLIALTIVVILMATLSSTIGIAWKQKRAAENAVENVRDVQTIGDILVEELQCALPPWVDMSGASGTVTATGSTGANGASVGGIVGSTFSSNSSTTGTESTYIEHLVGPFRGDQTSVGFYAAGADSKSEIRGDVRWVEFTVVSGYSEDGLDSLVRRVENNVLRPDWIVDEPVGTDLDEEVLLNHVIEIQFQYADVDGSLYDTWYSEDHENTLPYAVVLELTLAPLGDNRENRVIKRTASIYTAAPPVQLPTDTTTNSGGATGLQF